MDGPYLIEAWRPSGHTNPEILFRRAEPTLAAAAAFVTDEVVPVDEGYLVPVEKVTIRESKYDRLAVDLGEDWSDYGEAELLAEWNRRFSFPQARGGSNG